jgi:hypothetical protein
MLGDFILGLFVGLIVVCINLIVAKTRDAAWAVKVKPQKVESFSTTRSPREALNSIVRFAQQNGYKVSALDELSNRVVFEESPSMMIWGFFFVIYVTERSDVSTVIDVGIKSKFIHSGSVVSSSLSRCANGIKAVL